MYMYIAYVCFVFGNYGSSYVMDKMIREWKTMGNKGIVLRENGKHMRKIRVDEHIVLILQFAQRTLITPKVGSKENNTCTAYREVGKISYYVLTGNTFVSVPLLA